MLKQTLLTDQEKRNRKRKSQREYMRKQRQIEKEIKYYLFL